MSLASLTEAVTTGALQSYDWLFTTFSPSTALWLGTFLVHEVTYIAVALLYQMADFIPFLQRWKIQTDEHVTPSMWWKCFRRVMFLHCVIELPMIVAFAHPMVSYFGMEIGAPLPSWRHVAFVCTISMIIEDFYFYWVHLLLHHPRIYKHIHKVHHEYSAPFGICAEYAHPAETLILGVGTVLGPLLFARHVVTLWAWLIVRSLQTVEVHSGYDFPWSPNRWLPFWGGAEYHDFHHKTTLGPYSSTFTWTDYWFGTKGPYLRDREKHLASGKSS